ncbi:DUF4393 domain-containing protein [Pediococcus inopinatus]|uniref:DUF4393 domain-containing protein n=1 Tax=Pediococcus inopinatus TaxID=114090 RepID=UPI002B2609A0|nr:DUF4393 domain-containing protein [Pediococcus inopinatus]WPC19454.1 DUF4393 domain-containing protein [Pediococcus inopinatus]
MDPIITNALMTFGAGFTAAAFSKAQGPAQVLDDAMTLVGFDKLHEVAQKKRVQRDQNIQQYKDSIAQNIVKIPKENIQEPPLSVVGPALEASKYYIEEKALREMFAKVIAQSMDNRVNNKIHTSFVDIIRQLSPYDAQFLQKLKSKHIYVDSPVATMKMVIKNTDGTEKTVFPIISIFDVNDDFMKNAVTINNLERLGILKYSADRWNVDDYSYSIYYNYFQITNVLKQHPEMSLTKTSFAVNNFGANFIDLCVE